MSLNGKRVVVIGGSSGIGFAIAESAQAQGVEIVIGSSRAANVESSLKRLNLATGSSVDLRDEASVARFFEETGAFDHLAITAGDWDGASLFSPSSDIDLMRARDAFAVRFWGVLAAVKYGSRSIAKNGSITLTSGVLAHRPRRGAPLATAVGGAVEHLTRGLAMDLAPLRVNAVCPGLVLTEHVRQMPQNVIDATVAAIPITRAASPAEAAQAYIYLMLNDYVTGQILPVDGGGLLV